MEKTKWYLGKLKNHPELPNGVFLEDFSWDCDWYWGGGYIGNRDFHCHFDGCFLEVPDIRGHPLGNFITPWTKLPDYIKPENCTVLRNGCAIWEPLSVFLDDPQYTENEWWRIKDLFKQFYVLKAAAECYQYGGHCTSKGRQPNETNKEMQDRINAHIRDVIIPLTRKALNHEDTETPKDSKDVGPVESSDKDKTV